MHWKITLLFFVRSVLKVFKVNCFHHIIISFSVSTNNTLNHMTCFHMTVNDICVCITMLWHCEWRVFNLNIMSKLSCCHGSVISWSILKHSSLSLSLYCVNISALSLLLEREIHNVRYGYCTLSHDALFSSTLMNVHCLLQGRKNWSPQWRSAAGESRVLFSHMCVRAHGCFICVCVCTGGEASGAC